MIPTTPSTIHLGLDVAKLTLQVDLAGRTLALPNTPAGYRTLLTHLRRLHLKTGRAPHVVCEGTGGYERAVVAALQAEPVAVSVHNAARVRAFARAQGRLAKTDVLDAVVLSDFGAAMQPQSDQPPTESEAALAALVIRRDQLEGTGGLGSPARRAPSPPWRQKGSGPAAKTTRRPPGKDRGADQGAAGRQRRGENARWTPHPGGGCRRGECLHAFGLPARTGNALTRGHRGARRRCSR